MSYFSYVVSAHFKPAHETSTSVQHRAIGLFNTSPDPEYENVLNKMLRTDALFAIQIATQILKSNLGFGGPW